MLAAVCVFSAPVLAGPLNPAWVAADATWVVHIDIEAVMASSLGTFLADPPASLRAKFDEVKSEIGLDPLKDVRSITVYGASEKPEEGMVIIASSPAVDGVLERLKTAGHYERVEDHGVVFHTWNEGGHTRYATVREGSASTRILFLADTRAQMEAGLSVVDGTSPHRAAGEPAPAPGSMVFAHGKSLPEKLREQCATNLIKLVEGLRVDVGESAGQLYANVTLVANSEENVAALKQSVQSVLAVVRLGSQGNPDLARICKSINLTSQGRDVGVGLTCAVADAVRELRAQADGAAPAAHRKDGDAGAVSTKAPGER
jgi:hypothetical protein